MKPFLNNDLIFKGIRGQPVMKKGGEGGEIGPGMLRTTTVRISLDSVPIMRI